VPANADPHEALGARKARHVLVVDDEPKIRQVVRAALRDEAELIVLDLGLPDLEGIEVCRRLRQWTTAPIIVLSARHSEDEKTALLDAGADDYVTKPFGTSELRARVRAHLRRARLAPLAGGDTPLEVGDLTIDVARRTVTRGRASVHLTPTEWGLLTALVTNAGKTLTHRQLFHAVWGSAHGDAQQYLRVYIAHLRRKVEDDPYAPRRIVTEPGVGYRFEPDA
jgi:two-component system KDP operon response regulator KdpE